MGDCPFCKRIAAGEYDYWDAYNVAFQPLNPVTPGHFLVVPRTHVDNALAAPTYAGRAVRFAGGLAAQMSLDACNLRGPANMPSTRRLPRATTPDTSPRPAGFYTWRDPRRVTPRRLAQLAAHDAHIAALEALRRTRAEAADGA